jgi:hypothetical protein
MAAKTQETSPGAGGNSHSLEVYDALELQRALVAKQEERGPLAHGPAALPRLRRQWTQPPAQHTLRVIGAAERARCYRCVASEGSVEQTAHEVMSRMPCCSTTAARQALRSGRHKPRGRKFMLNYSVHSRPTVQTLFCIAVCSSFVSPVHYHCCKQTTHAWQPPVTAYITARLRTLRPRFTAV